MRTLYVENTLVKKHITLVTEMYLFPVHVTYNFSPVLCTAAQGYTHYRRMRKILNNALVYIYVTTTCDALSGGNIKLIYASSASVWETYLSHSGEHIP